MDVLVIDKGIDIRTSWWVRVMFQGDMSRNRDGRRSKEDNAVHNRYCFMIRCGPETVISLIYSTLTGIKSNHCGGERLPSCHGTSPSAPYVVWCSNREQTYRISMAKLSFSIKLILEKRLSVQMLMAKASIKCCKSETLTMNSNARLFGVVTSIQYMHVCKRGTHYCQHRTKHKQGLLILGVRLPCLEKLKHPDVLTAHFAIESLHLSGG